MLVPSSCFLGVLVMSDRQKRRILVVEDGLEIREGVCRELSSLGYEVDGVEHGQAALAFLELDPDFDLIILDLEMPVMDGMEFRSQQQQHADLRQIPVLLFSSSVHAAATAKSLGCAGFASKNLPELMALVQRLV